MIMEKQFQNTWLSIVEMAIRRSTAGMVNYPDPGSSGMPMVKRAKKGSINTVRKAGSGPAGTKTVKSNTRPSTLMANPMGCIRS